MDRGGLRATDGPTHHGLFDNQLPALHPRHGPSGCDNETSWADMLFTALHHDGPHRHPLSARTGPAWRSRPSPELISHRQGRGDQARHAAVILGLGALLPWRWSGPGTRTRGFSVAVINPRSVKPLDGI